MSENIAEAKKQEEKKFQFNWVKQFSYLTIKSVVTEINVNEATMKIQSVSKVLGVGKGKKKSWNKELSEIKSAETKKLVNYIDLAFAAMFIIGGFSNVIYFALAALFLWTGININIVLETTDDETIKIPANSKKEAEEFVSYIIRKGKIQNNNDAGKLDNPVPETTYNEPDSKDKYLVMNSKKSDKISEEELVRMYHSNEISKDTKVWRKGMDEWTEFGKLGIVKDDDAPPPMTGDDVENTYIWIMACAPIIGMIIESFLPGELVIFPGVVGVLVVVLLSSYDNKVLINAGYSIDEHKKWAAVIPVYLYKRAKAVKQKPIYVAVWCVLFIMILLFSSTIAGVIGINDHALINMVKDGYFNSNGQYSVGYMADQFLDDVSWSSHAFNDGNIYVRLSGNTFTYDYNGHVELWFLVRDRYFEPVEMAVDGEVVSNLAMNSFIYKMKSYAIN